MTHSNKHLIWVGLWLFGSLVAALVAMGFSTAAIVGGEYVPVGNDAFYHGRRIIDAAVSSRGFYQMDDTIHVPEGSWLTWPWGYDFLMAAYLKLVVALTATPNHMAVLAYVPVAFVALNLALFLAILRRLNVSLAVTLAAVLAFALSPLVQLLHGLGAIDHHFVELTFALLAVWFGLRFFDANSRDADAVWLGVALGAAPAFHNSLFVLQIPVAACVAWQWLRQQPIEKRQTTALATSLLVATCAFLLPSATFRDLQFQFGTHSWFHLYASAATALFLFLLARLRFSPVNLIGAAIGVSVLSVPLLAELARGTSFLDGSLVLLDRITEVRSPWELYTEAGEHLGVTRYYSWLVFLTPIALVYAAVELLRAKKAQAAFFSLAAIFGMTLMLAQFRLHPFGYWALLAVVFHGVDRIAGRLKLEPLAATAGALLLVALAYQPPLRAQLFVALPPGLTAEYGVTYPLYIELGQQCESRPGVVLASTDDGHPIRYHSACSVIANNFLLTEQHAEKALQVEALLQLTPAALLQQPVELGYVLVRLQDVFVQQNDEWVVAATEHIDQVNSTLAVALTQEAIPAGFELISELRLPGDNGRAFARLFRVTSAE